MRTCPMRGPGVKFDEVKTLLYKTIGVSSIVLDRNNLMFQLETKWKVIISTAR